jgi:hypothetical protein
MCSDPYRYFLVKGGENLGGEGRLLVVGYNPSKADSLHINPFNEATDPTAASVLGIAIHHGFGSVCMVNPFALRTKDPKMLFRLGLDPIGSYNDKHIAEQAASATTIVIAWGKLGETGPGKDKVLTRRADVLRLLKGYELYRFAAEETNPKLKGRYPWHPARIRSSTRIVPYLEAMAGVDQCT